VRRIWLSAYAWKLHLTLVVVGGGCLAFGWWMFERARHGDGAAWVYTFEWPIFAVYAGYMWWRLLHDEERMTSTPPARRAASPSASEAASTLPADKGERVQQLGFDPYDDEDPDLAAYNRYLAALHDADRSRPWARTGGAT
jgi:hypothetical protein